MSCSTVAAQPPVLRLQYSTSAALKVGSCHPLSPMHLERVLNMHCRLFSGMSPLVGISLEGDPMVDKEGAAPQHCKDKNRNGTLGVYVGSVL